jgi:hypothetical protein
MDIKQERFKITLKEDFDQTLLTHVEEVFHSENLLQAVIYGHLLLERALNSLIAQRMKRPEILEDKFFGRWSFLQKLGLYVALYDPSKEQELLLVGFNRLRNAMAHGLESNERAVAKHLPWKGPSPPRDARHHVWATTANLFLELGIVHGIEHVELTHAEALNVDAHDEPALASARSGSASDDRSKSFPEAVGKDRSMEVQFRHPRTSLLLIADVSPQCSGELALTALLSEGFLSPVAPRAYELYLHRTETHIAPHMSFEEAGVIDGDLIDVILPMQGAGSTTLVEELENDQPIELHFMHPRSSKTVMADVSPQCSGEEALAALLYDAEEDPFLAPLVTAETYELYVHRTDTYIAPHTTFKQAGTIDGDLIDIKISLHGSRWSHKRASP